MPRPLEETAERGAAGGGEGGGEGGKHFKQLFARDGASGQLRRVDWQRHLVTDGNVSESVSE